MKKVKIPHVCQTCGCDLHIIGNDFKDYVYLHKIGAYVCDDCFCQRKHKNGGGGE